LSDRVFYVVDAIPEPCVGPWETSGAIGNRGYK